MDAEEQEHVHEEQGEEAFGFVEEQEEDYFAHDDAVSENEEVEEAVTQAVQSALEDAPIDAPQKHFSTEEAVTPEYYSDLDDGLHLDKHHYEAFVIPTQDKVTSTFFKKMIQEEHPIVEHIINFNLRKANTVHVSHYVGIGDFLFKHNMLHTMLSSRRASLYCTEHLEILVGKERPKEMWFTDFESYKTRFALLPGNILEELSIFLGMMIFHARVRKIVQHEGVTQLRTLFGKRATDFGIRRVPLFLHNVDSLYNLFKLPHHWEIEDLIRESGRYGLGLCVSTLPSILQKTIVLKLPRKFLSTDEYEPHAVGPDDFSKVQKQVLSEKLFPLLRKILTLEVAPEWTPFFF